MSTLKVDAIRHNSATSDAITMASDGTCTAKLTSVGGGQLSHRNLIINGAMNVAQRGVSSTANLYQTTDRFRTSSNYLGSITLTQSQEQLTSSDTPYSSGFRYFHRVALSGAGTVLSNGYIGISQRLEAQDVAQSGWNYTSASSYITIQFWFRCSTNQTFYMALTSQDGTRQSYPFAFTASGNNAWTKITKTIPGNSNLQFDLNTDRGLTVSFTPWYGTDWTGSKALDQWSAFSGSAEYPDYASTWLTAGASTFDITGVQLEVGDIATSFEHRSFGDELARCQRYFYKIQGDAGARVGIGGCCVNSTEFRMNVTFPVTMRALPTISGTGTAQMDALNDSADFNCSIVTIESAPTGLIHSLGLQAVTSGMTGGQGGNLRFRSNGSSLSFDAEI